MKLTKLQWTVSPSAKLVTVTPVGFSELPLITVVLPNVLEQPTLRKYQKGAGGGTGNAGKLVSVIVREPPATSVMRPLKVWRPTGGPTSTAGMVILKFVIPAPVPVKPNV